MGESQWTVDTLREWMLDKFLSEEKAVQAALAAAEKAVLKAESEARAWREQANEWRSAMTDRERRFATLPAIEALSDRITSLERRANTGEGRGLGLNAAVGYLLAAVAIAGFIVSILVR